MDKVYDNLTIAKTTCAKEEELNGSLIVDTIYIKNLNDIGSIVSCNEVIKNAGFPQKEWVELGKITLQPGLWIVNGRFELNNTWYSVSDLPENVDYFTKMNLVTNRKQMANTQSTLYTSPKNFPVHNITKSFNLSEETTIYMHGWCNEKDLYVNNNSLLLEAIKIL